MSENEIEVKFYLVKPAELEQCLKKMGAELVTPRVHEVNLRFDTPDGTLTREHRVLRLRQDLSAYLTYKGSALMGQSVSVRREIEIEVSSFETAKDFLEALGYQVSIMYEKYRTTYSLGNCIIVVDEMPYGNFAEIEGHNAEDIQKLAELLHLDWNARILDSYLGLFDHLRQGRGLSAHDLSFIELQNITISAVDLGVVPADES